MMMTNMDGMFPGFYATHKAWYADSWKQVDPCVTAEVMVGYYDDEGGTAGEFAFRWMELGGKGEFCRLEAFDDGWKSLVNLPGILSFLKEHAVDSGTPSFTPDDLIFWLKVNGYSDLTPYTRDDEE